MRNIHGDNTSWPRRWMAALPPISDRAMVIGFMGLLLVVGFVSGMVFCTQKAVDQAVDRMQQRPLVERVQALEERVLALQPDDLSQQPVITLPSATTYICPSHQTPQRRNRSCVMRMTEPAGVLTILGSYDAPEDGQVLTFGLSCTFEQQLMWAQVFVGRADLPLPTVCPGDQAQWLWVEVRYSRGVPTWELLRSTDVEGR